MSHLQNDVRLIDRAQRGDDDAFGALYRLYQHRVRAIVAHYAQGDDAEDLLQMVFMKVFMGLDRFRGDSAFTTWLTRIALNVCASHLRSLRARRNGLADLERRMLAPTPAATPEDVTLVRERQHLVTQSMRALPEAQQQALWLRYIRDLSYQEIERELEVPLGTVKIWLYRGRHQLKHALAKLDEMPM